MSDKLEKLLNQYIYYLAKEEEDNGCVNSNNFDAITILADNYKDDVVAKELINKILEEGIYIIKKKIKCKICNCTITISDYDNSLKILHSLILHPQIEIVENEGEFTAEHI